MCFSSEKTWDCCGQDSGGVKCSSRKPACVLVWGSDALLPLEADWRPFSEIDGMI